MFKYLLTLIVSVLIAAPAIAQNNFDCEIEKERIFADLKRNAECVHDSDCGYFNYGYPWQPDMCMMAIINIKDESRNIANLRVIEQYNERCIYNNEEENKKYQEFSKALDEAECREPARTYCFKGFCRILSYAIYNDE